LAVVHESLSRRSKK